MSFCTLLIYFILTHQFQYAYVWNYSSTDLPTPLLISTFYAGQEGSFSLWTLYASIIGVILMQYTSRKNYEPEVMFVWTMIVSFLLLMLIVKNPFAMIWENFPKDLVHTGPVPYEPGPSENSPRSSRTGSSRSASGAGTIRSSSRRTSPRVRSFSARCIA